MYSIAQARRKAGNVVLAANTGTAAGGPTAVIPPPPGIPFHNIRPTDGRCTEPAIIETADKLTRLLAKIHQSIGRSPCGTFGEDVDGYEADGAFQCARA